MHMYNLSTLSLLVDICAIFNFRLFQIKLLIVYTSVQTLVGTLKHLWKNATER